MLHSIPASIFKSLKSSLPLIVIGLARVVAVKALNYQEVVTEYGLHWNFFFTLVAVKVRQYDYFASLNLLTFSSNEIVLQCFYDTYCFYLCSVISKIVMMFCQVGCTILFCSLSSRLWNIAGILTIAMYQVK